MSSEEQLIMLAQLMDGQDVVCLPGSQIKLLLWEVLFWEYGNLNISICICVNIKFIQNKYSGAFSSHHMILILLRKCVFNLP